MNRFLKMTSLATLCALLAVPAGAGAALIYWGTNR